MKCERRLENQASARADAVGRDLRRRSRKINVENPILSELFESLHDSGSVKTGIPLSELSRHWLKALVASQRLTPFLRDLESA
jgi:hypothetical protein